MSRFISLILRGILTRSRSGSIGHRTLSTGLISSNIMQSLKGETGLNFRDCLTPKFFVSYFYIPNIRYYRSNYFLEDIGYFCGAAFTHVWSHLPWVFTDWLKGVVVTFLSVHGRGVVSGPHQYPHQCPCPSTESWAQGWLCRSQYGSYGHTRWLSCIIWFLKIHLWYCTCWSSDKQQDGWSPFRTYFFNVWF